MDSLRSHGREGGVRLGPGSLTLGCGSVFCYSVVIPMSPQMLSQETLRNTDREPRGSGIPPGRWAPCPGDVQTDPRPPVELLRS